MFDKQLVEDFNTYFSGNQMPELNRIKSEIELIGYSDFAELTWSQIQDFPTGEEQDRVFKNAIFVATQDLRHDEDLEAYRLLLMALEYWPQYWDRSFDEFKPVGLLRLNDLLNEAFLHSWEDEAFDEIEPEDAMEILERLEKFVNVQDYLFEALNKAPNTEACFIWQLKTEKLSEGYWTDFGPSNFGFVPDFGGYLFNKILFFAMSWWRHELLSDEQIEQPMFNKSAQMLFADEIQRMKSEGEIEHLAHGDDFSFSSLKEALEKVVSLYSEQLVDLGFEKSSQDVFLSFVANLSDES